MGSVCGHKKNDQDVNRGKLTFTSGSTPQITSAESTFKSATLSFQSCVSMLDAEIQWTHFQEVYNFISETRHIIESIYVLGRPINHPLLPQTLELKHWCLKCKSETYILTLQFWEADGNGYFGYEFEPASAASLGHLKQYQTQLANGQVNWVNYDVLAYFNLRGKNIYFHHLADGIQYFYQIRGGKYNGAESNCQRFVVDVLNKVLARPEKQDYNRKSQEKEKEKEKKIEIYEIYPEYKEEFDSLESKLQSWVEQKRIAQRQAIIKKKTNARIIGFGSRTKRI